MTEDPPNSASADLPFSIFINQNDRTTPHRITIHKSVPHPSIHDVSSVNSCLISFNDSIATSLKSDVFCIEDHGNGLRHGWLIRVPGTNCFRRVYGKSSAEADSSVAPPELARNVNEAMESWKLGKLAESTHRRVSNFSMKAPVLNPPPTNIQPFTSPQSETKPLNFIQSRYYNTLYSFTTPLSYFPKTAISRLKVMCGDDRAAFKEVLLEMRKSPDDISKRYDLKLNLPELMLGEIPEVSIVKYEIESQRIFIEKHYDSLHDSSKFGRLLLELKIREAQLQILIHLELILACQIDDQSFVEKCSANMTESSKPKKKKRLIRKTAKSSAPSNMIPTLLGVGVFEETTTTPEVNTDQTIFNSVTTFVELCAIWDMLLGGKNGSKKESTYEFLAYVLLPFYNKILPRTVGYVVSRVKDLRPNLKTKKRLQKRVNGSEDSKEAPEKKKSRFTKKLIRREQRPFLDPSTTEIEPAFLLKRSKSNLGSKNMQRRQVDMSVAQKEKLEEERPSFLFGDARKTKLVSLPPASPPPLRKSTQVMRTPSVKRIDRQIPETPQRSTSLVQKLTQVAENVLIISSPEVIRSDGPNIFLHSHGIRSSPPEPITSSPSKRVPELDSPFKTRVPQPHLGVGDGPPAFIVEQTPKSNRTVENVFEVHSSSMPPPKKPEEVASPKAQLNTDTDTDSDYERLLILAASKSSLRKYRRRY